MWEAEFFLREGEEKEKRTRSIFSPAYLNKLLDI